MITGYQKPARSRQQEKDHNLGGKVAIEARPYMAVLLSVMRAQEHGRGESTFHPLLLSPKGLIQLLSHSTAVSYAAGRMLL
jgi:hypothetical protein